MVINRDSLTIYESYNIRIPEPVLVKLEDSIRSNKEMLLTIAASHYGFRNRNWTVYRHDTVKHDITTFVAPKPKPIIQKHDPKNSDVFGHVIAADYKLTKFYDSFAKSSKLEKLTTDQYISLIKDTILPYQRQNPYFDGLAFLELVGRLSNKDSIQKVLSKEFLTVSIGAKPNRLICSECGQDQVVKMCGHYGNKSNNTFMLAESLDYEELSFVARPADPFGRITTVHDSVQKEYKFEIEQTLLDACMDAIPMKDFFHLTDKTIVCVDNICTIINQEENSMKKKETANTVTVSYQGEFGPEKIKGLLDSFGEGVTLSDQDLDALTDRQFAIVQKTDDGIKRRFQINDEVNVKLAMNLLRDAADLSPAEYDKAFTVITKAAKKFGVEGDILVKDEEETTTTEGTEGAEGTEEGTTEEGTEGAEGSTEENVDNQDSDNGEADPVKALCDQFVEAINAYCQDYYNEDGTLKVADGETEAKEPPKPSPLSVLFAIISGFSSELGYAARMLQGSIDSYLKELGKEAVDKSHKDHIEAENQTLKDQVTELEEEVALLDEQGRTLNKQLRDHFVEEIISHKKALGLIDSDETAEKARYSGLGYEALQVCMNDYRTMRVKIKDSTVNNTTEISTVTDPTKIADSDNSQQDTEGGQSPAARKPVTKEDAINIINGLKNRYGFLQKP